MVSLPLLWFLFSIDFNSYIGTCLGAEGTSDAKFRFLHVCNFVPASVILCRTIQDVFGTDSYTQAAALTPLSINYYGSF